MAADSGDSSGNGIFWFLGFVVLLMCVGTPLYVVYRNHTDKAAKEGMTVAATAYLDALREGKYDAAYQWVCGSERKKYTLDKWRPRHDHPAVTGYRIVKPRVEDVNDAGTLYYVDTEITYADGETVPKTLFLSDERAGWRVCYTG
ncbi:Rv0361 family membrane protein [Catellatospora tritici]|uniref:Rv0361 family membrane protein n=1 Tax=Catellatospora tritici TaxID=2851566 RepID=UPI001C2D5817|nr:hypothetical protein [Catellatospora tritici]MBV1850713.1 hypothetical protein [Catellatospora tritici]MBV1850966.1 hypothetical protein [Catellatospora tritici]